MANKDKQAILDGLGQLDANNDDHWTADGLPRLDVMKDLSGVKDLNRDTVTKANPKFNRDSLLNKDSENETDDDQEDGDDADLPSIEQQEHARQETETLIKNELVTNPGNPELAKALSELKDPNTGQPYPEGTFADVSDNIGEMDNEITNQEGELNKVEKLIDKLQRHKSQINQNLDRIRVKREFMATRPGEDHGNIREYLNAQQQQREGRAGITTQLQAQARELGGTGVDVKVKGVKK